MEPINISKKSYIAKNNYIRKNPNITFQNINKDFPHLAKLLIKELLKVDGYSDTEISFGAGIRLDIIRKIATGSSCYISQTTFFRILGLYAKVFCDWEKINTNELFL